MILNWSSMGEWIGYLHEFSRKKLDKPHNIIIDVGHMGLWHPCALQLQNWSWPLFHSKFKFLLCSLFNALQLNTASVLQFYSMFYLYDEKLQLQPLTQSWIIMCEVNYVLTVYTLLLFTTTVPAYYNELLHYCTFSKFQIIWTLCAYNKLWQ